MRNIYLSIIFIFLRGLVYSQEIVFRVDGNSIPTDILSNITQSISTTSKSAAINVSENGIQRFEIQTTLSGNDTTRIIILNEKNNQYITFLNSDPKQRFIELTPLLLTELRESVLGEATSYQVIETDANFEIRSSRRAELPTKNIEIPVFNYGEKENVKQASPKERKLKAIIRNRYSYIPKNPNDPELMKQIEELSEETAFNAYYFEFPDGNAIIYNDNRKEQDYGQAELTPGSLPIDVTCSNTAPDAQTAIMYAANIYSDALSGSQTVKIRVNFTSFGSNILGQCSNDIFQIKTKEGYDAWAPTALASQLLGYQVVPGSDDMSIQINNNVAWYTGTDGYTPGSKYDLVTTALHEILHGLGFSSRISDDGSYFNGLPGPFDLLIQSEGTFLKNMTDDQRTFAILSNKLYFSGYNTKAANGGAEVKLFAPSMFQTGSSISHWDNSVTFPTFVKWTTEPGFSIHSINSRELALLQDLGWTVAKPGLTYAFNNTTGALSIGGSGTTVETDKVKAAVGSNTLKSVDFTHATGITTIWNGAFSGYMELTSITLPQGVTTIQDKAFSDCTRLTSISIPKGVKVIRDLAFFNCTGLTSISLPEGLTSIRDLAFFNCTSLTNISLPQGITTIGISAFAGCSGLTSITIPQGITIIGASAFSGCSGLTTITLPQGLTAIQEKTFAGCSSLTSIALPQGLTTIGVDAFNSCSGLTSITIPQGITIIGAGAFSGCSGLTSITLPQGLTAIQEKTFAGCIGLTSIVLPQGLTTIGVDAFNSCSGLTTISIPQGITIIGASAFSGCSGLASISLPNGLTTIAYSAFNSCSGLTSITLPLELKTIGAGAFSGCSGLTSITLPQGIKIIGASTFSGCRGLSSITFPQGLMVIEEIAFAGCSGLSSITLPHELKTIRAGAFSGCSGLSSITFPQGLMAIEQRAFSGCSDLTSIKLPNGLTRIEAYTFNNCSGLTSITLPHGVTTIGAFALDSCSSLTSISLPEGMTSIGDMAFEGCSRLTSVTCNATIPPKLGSNVFRGIPEYDTLYIPLGSETDYRAAEQWKEFSMIKTTGDSLIYTFDVSTGMLTITGNGTTVGSSKVNTAIGRTSVSEQNITLKGVDFSRAPGITTIGNDAFRNCSGLSSITLPQGLTTIGELAFYYCSGLTSIALPKGVTFIGNSAFFFCTQLTSVTCNAATPPELGMDVFFFVPQSSGTLYVSKGSETDYKAAKQWKEFGIIDVVTGISQIQASRLKVFPSPSRGVVNIETPDESEAAIKVYNLQGRLLFETEGNRVDLSGYISGIYMLNIDGEVVKVVKK